LREHDIGPGWLTAQPIPANAFHVSSEIQAPGPAGAAAASDPHLLLVCRTCARFAPRQEWGAETPGVRLAEAVRAQWEHWPRAASFALRVVTCLGGCPNPCNAALSGPDKWRLRVRHLTPGDAAVLLELAAAYHAHADGNLQAHQIPAILRERIGARTPPYAALCAAASGPDNQPAPDRSIAQSP
jgi:predicted metal-binding protein